METIMLSTHKCEVVPVVLEKHPNADSLSLVQVFGGYTCAVRSDDWKDGDLAAYIPPDSLVPIDRPEFAFLDSGKGRAKERVKAKKIRGIPSFGLLVKAPDGTKEGQDVAEILGVEHYDPDVHGSSGGAKTSGQAVSGPPGVLTSKYDIDSLRRYRDVFIPGEMVHVTEKIHGANSRYCFKDGEMYCGSRTEWKADDGNLWWRALRVHPEIGKFCRKHPGEVLYGEVYGNVQSLKYGLGKEVRFAAFDVLRTDGIFYDSFELWKMLQEDLVPQVPLIDMIHFDFDAVCALAEGFSAIPGANHVREGCVVKPLHERCHQAVGRVILKVVGLGYLEKS